MLELTGSSGAGWMSGKQARHVRGRCTDSFEFFRIPLDERVANTYFLAPFYCFGQPIHCLEISGNKNNLRLKSPKTKSSPASAESYWFLYKKITKRVRPRPHCTVFKGKRYCFVPDTATVHTTTPKTISVNGSFRKRSPEWNDLKLTVLFENAVFLVWTAKTMLSENDDVTITTPPGCRPLDRKYTR